jgi:putative Mg2+ transporter-C (MgtC) family protein
MSWLLESWHRLLPEPLAAIFLALVAVFCGAWVGIEREHKEKPAGLRTMALVSLGSSVFTMVGYVFTSNSGDSGRVAAQIVAGIGFLGGGILLKGPGGVEGTTTAATIWTVAAMGMSIGAGYVSAGIGIALTVRCVLSLVGRWESTAFGGRRTETLSVEFEPNNGKTEIKIDCLLDKFGILHAKERCRDVPANSRRVVRTIFFLLWLRSPRSLRSNAPAEMKHRERPVDKEIELAQRESSALTNLSRKLLSFGYARTLLQT